MEEKRGEGGEGGEGEEVEGVGKKKFSFRSPLKAFRSPPVKSKEVEEGKRGGEEGKKEEKNEEFDSR